MYKIKRINLPWNQITGRLRKPLVLPKGKFKIPTAEVTLKVELIEEFRVLRKLAIDGKWCFVIVDENDHVKVVAFDDYGNGYDITYDPERARELGPTASPKMYWGPNE